MQHSYHPWATFRARLPLLTLAAGLFIGAPAAAQQAGTLDASFGTGGRVLGTFLSTSGSDVAKDVIVQPDGKIVVAGQTNAGAELARFNADGTPDTSFGTGGKASYAFGAVTVGSLTSTLPSRPRTLQRLANGQYYLVGRTGSAGFVARIQPDGTLDATFGTGGVVKMQPGSHGQTTYDLGLQSSGKVVLFNTVANNSSYSATINRHNTNGSQDLGFGPTGSVFITFLSNQPAIGGLHDAGLTAGKVLDNDQLLVAGMQFNAAYGYCVGLARLQANGALDTSFDTDGIATLPRTVGGSTVSTITYALAVQPDGKALVAGSYAVDGSNFGQCMVARFGTDGALDTSFGTGGIVTLSFPGKVGQTFTSLALQPDGKMVAAGYVQNSASNNSDTDFLLVRLNADGTPDSGFGTNGAALLNENTQDIFRTVALQANGAIVAVGYAASGGGTLSQGLSDGGSNGSYFNINDDYFNNPQNSQFGVYRFRGAATPLPPFTWTGAASAVWTDPANWSSNQVPGAADDATIPGGLTRYPVLSGNQAVRGLNLQTTATLTQNAGTLTVNGAFVSAGTFTQAGGTLALAGSSAQTLGAAARTTSLLNLQVGAAGAALSGPVQVRGLLTLQGNLTATFQQPLTLVSDANGTASVYNNGGAVLGPVTVQRYLSPGLNPGPGYRHLSSPVAVGGRVANLAPGTAVINPTYNSSANPALVTPFPTVFTYNEQRLTGSGATASFDYGWESPSALSEALVPGRGYTSNTAPATLTFDGQLTNGPVNIPLVRSAAGQGWNLVGNPYPSPLDWDQVVLPATIDGAAYVYRSTGPYTGGYQAYVNGVGAPGARVLAMGQAFFVRANTGTPTLALTNAARPTTLLNPALNRTLETRPLLALTVRGAGSSPAADDVFFVYQQAGATPGFDGRFDALKVQLNGGQQPSLYQQVGAEGLSIQGLPTGNQPLSLPLTVYAPQAGTYAFEATQLLNLPAAGTYLEDRQTGAWHELSQGAYSAQLAQGLTATRFVLHLHAARPLATAKQLSAALAVYPNPASGRQATVEASGLPAGPATLRLLNSLGQVVRAETLQVRGILRHELLLTGLAEGVYSLQLSTAAGTATQRLVVQ
ncbi:T9SS type A sorting domain-containing protein [Hymenobacter gummosus]|uniref:T9SS type A sorting domain-containing protein n=1 Tax=Hymenobacter gummosus TaxID=1776032 RepID=A0A431U323_9BACT|nr:T9SS type A sorting domain-containing protein [Hymenobacter gummosus]RTQ49704.1 T9SS type A sorting domain-containing protein [Hymenobacter gummosus]